MRLLFSNPFVDDRPVIDPFALSVHLSPHDFQLASGELRVGILAGEVGAVLEVVQSRCQRFFLGGCHHDWQLWSRRRRCCRDWLLRRTQEKEGDESEVADGKHAGRHKPSLHPPVNAPHALIHPTQPVEPDGSPHPHPARSQCGSRTLPSRPAFQRQSRCTALIATDRSPAFPPGRAT